jgi:twitching motility two-component system response regulator PilG
MNSTTEQNRDNHLNAAGVQEDLEVNEIVTDLTGVKIVVVDDSKTIRRSAESLLGRAGATVLTAEDGFEALSLIVDTHPDMVFVDVMMPRLDGYQTCSMVKSNPAFRDIPVVMLSSKDGLFDIAKGRVVGSEEYVTKPFTKDQLIGAVQRHVSARRREVS